MQESFRAMETTSGLTNRLKPATGDVSSFVSQAVRLTTESGAFRSIDAAIPHLRAVVLLGGSVRPSRFSHLIGRSLLDLPIDEQQTVLDNWVLETAALAGALGRKSLPLRVLVDQNSPSPAPRTLLDPQVLMSIEMDPASFRGTGGLLHDLAQTYENNDYILVTNAAKVLLTPLAHLASALAQASGDVRLLLQDDGTPTSTMLVRCASLRDIAPVGFVDFKEQALPTMGGRFHVSVVRRPPSDLGFRNLYEYIRAVRVHHLVRSCGPLQKIDPYAEDWRPSFALVESGAQVAQGARIHDSVILRGARVETGATVVRSVVCADAVVRTGRIHVEAVVTASGSESPP
jgi:hypothetical protein